MNVELVVQVLGVKLGAGFGYNDTNTTSHTEGEGHSITGGVAGLENIGQDVSPFEWTVGWFKYKIGNQEFPVVQYAVKKP
jgi:hypothetical protein